MPRGHNRRFPAVAAFVGAWAALATSTACAVEATPAPTVAERSGPDAEAWFRFPGRLNKYGALEPAGSRGSIGMGLGAGVVAEEAPSSALATGQMHLSQRPSDERRPYYLPKVWLAKGLPWPVDFGLTAASATEGRFTQAGGYAQVTPFEALAWPALTVRASYARLFGLADTEFTSYGLDAVVSYSFLRYLTVYGVFGETRHQAALAWSADEQTDLGYALAPGEGAGAVTRAWLDPTRAAGLKIMVLPPFVSITTEAAWVEGEPRHYAAKLTLGM